MSTFQISTGVGWVGGGAGKRHNPRRGEGGGGGANVQVAISTGGWVGGGGGEGKCLLVHFFMGIGSKCTGDKCL